MTHRLATLALLGYLVPAAAAAGAPELLPSLEAALVARLASERQKAGVGRLAPHVGLDRAAAERAAALATRQRLASTPAEVTQLTDALWRLGYGPHYWREAVIAGDLDAAQLGRSRFDAELLRSDLEHVAVACRPRTADQVLCLLLVGQRRLTKELEDAEPLRDLTRVRAVLLETVNRERQAAGRRLLVGHQALDQAAQAHAEAMLAGGFYAHRAPDGSSPRDRASAAGYSPRVVAENIARALVAPETVVEQWMASSGHRDNLLLRRALHHGLGVAVGVRDDRVEVLWCELLAAP